MTAPNHNRQSAARQVLDKVFRDTDNVQVVHYSCEGFYDRTIEKSPRITSIAIRKYSSAQTLSFSIHQAAELSGIDFCDISEHYDELEKKMLDQYYQHVSAHRGVKYIHWNMRDSNYGFPAIDHRFQFLGGEPVEIEDDKKFDLARLLVDIYGGSYAEHPRLKNVIKMNLSEPRDMLSGSDEADAFERGDYVALHQSTLRKVDVLANIAQKAHEGILKTNTTWWQMRGGRVKNVVEWLADHKLFVLLASLASIVGLFLAL